MINPLFQVQRDLEMLRPVTVGARVLIMEPKRRWERTDCFEEPLKNSLAGSRAGWHFMFSHKPIVEQCKYRGQVVAIFDHPKRLENGERRRVCVVSVDQLGLIALDCSDDKRGTVRVLMGKGESGKYRPMSSTDMIRWRDVAYKLVKDKVPHIQHPKDNSRCGGCGAKVEDVLYHTIPGQFIYIVKLKERTDYNGNPIVMISHPSELGPSDYDDDAATDEQAKQDQDEVEHAVHDFLSDDEEGESGSDAEGKQRKKEKAAGGGGGGSKKRPRYIPKGFGASAVNEKLHHEPHLLEKVMSSWYDSDIKFEGVYGKGRTLLNFHRTLDREKKKLINEGGTIV